MGTLEKIEDIDHLRFIENGVPIYYTRIDSESLSVDTKNDLEVVRSIIQNRTV
jgi:3-deoxy-manno-octulosonate cytidylyltransferase (CMP-KDO synthetase)